MKGIKAKVICLVLTVAMALSGCMQERTTVTIPESGNATVAINLYFQKEIVDELYTKSEIEELKAEFEKEGVTCTEKTVSGVDYYVVGESGSCSVSKLKSYLNENAFSSLDMLGVTATVKSASKTKLQVDITAADAQTAAEYKSEGLLDGFKFVLTVSFPSKIVCTNGTISSSNPKKVTFTYKDISKNKTMYASTESNKCKITYKTKGGTTTSKTTYKYGTTYTLKKAKRAGYTFKGWYKDSSYTSKVTKISSTTIGDKTFYAKWEKVKVSKAKISNLTNKSGKKVKVTIKKVSGAKGYQIKYSTSSKYKNAIKVSTTSTKKTISGLKKGKTYYFKVRAYKIDSAGKKVYGDWSSTKKIKVSK